MKPCSSLPGPNTTSFCFRIIPCKSKSIVSSSTVCRDHHKSDNGRWFVWRRREELDQDQLFSYRSPNDHQITQKWKPDEISLPSWSFFNLISCILIISSLSQHDIFASVYRRTYCLIFLPSGSTLLRYVFDILPCCCRMLISPKRLNFWRFLQK